jgi:hypothetical protein
MSHAALARLAPHGGRIAVAMLWVSAFSGWLAPRSDAPEPASDPTLHRVFERVEGGDGVALVVGPGGDVWWITRAEAVRFAGGNPARREVALDAPLHRARFGGVPAPFSAAQVDARDGLWLGTQSGEVLCHRDGAWQRVQSATGPRAAIRALATRGDELYVASVGLWRSTGGGPLEELAPFAGVPVDRISADVDQGVAIAAAGRVFRSDAGGWREVWRARDATVSALALAPDGELWIGTASGLVRIDHSGRAVHELRDLSMDALVPGDAGASLAGGAGLFTRYAAGWRRVEAVGELAVSEVSHLAPASYGALWIAMTGRGLYRVRPGAAQELPRSWAVGSLEPAPDDARAGTRGASESLGLFTSPPRI